MKELEEFYKDYYLTVIEELSNIDMDKERIKIKREIQVAIRSIFLNSLGIHNGKFSKYDLKDSSPLKAILKKDIEKIADAIVEEIQENPITEVQKADMVKGFKSTILKEVKNRLKASATQVSIRVVKEAEDSLSLDPIITNHNKLREITDG